MFCFPFIRNNESYYFTIGGNPTTGSPTVGSLTDPTTATSIKLIATPSQYQIQNQAGLFTTSAANSIVNSSTNVQNLQQSNLTFGFSNSQIVTAIKEEQHPHNGTVSSMSLISSHQLQHSLPQQPTTAVLNFDQFYNNHVHHSTLISPTSLTNPPTIIVPAASNNAQFVVHNGGQTNTNIISNSKPPEHQQVSVQSHLQSVAAIESQNSIVVTSTSNGNSIPVTIPAQLLTTKGDQVVCLKCSKIFANKYTLKTHQRTHLGIKDYKCELCDKCFSQKINLTYHMKTHSGEKGFLCPLCQKTFTQLGNCRAHCLKKHGVEIEKKRRGKGKSEIVAVSVASKNDQQQQQHPQNGINTSATSVNNGPTINVPQYSTINISNLINMNIKY